MIDVPPRPGVKAQAKPQARKLRHILLLSDQRGRRAISMNAALYSVGSASSNAIVLASDSVAPRHALFVRVPDPNAPDGYRYRILCGNDSGFEGTAAITVNGMTCSSHDLRPGDRIRFSADIEVSYHCAALTDEQMSRYARPASFRRVKSVVSGGAAQVSAVSSAMDAAVMVA